VFGVLLSLISIPLLIRHLGESDYGLYVTVISIVTIVQGVTDVGLGQIGVREYATRAGPEQLTLMRNLLGVRFTMTAIGVALGTAFAALAGYSHTVVLGTVLAGIGMVLTVVQGTFAVPLSVRLQLGWVTALDLMRQVLSVSAIVVLVLAGAQLLAFLAIAVPVAAAVLVATVLLVRGSMPLRPSFQKAEWLVLMRAVLPFAAAVVVGTLYLRVTVVIMSLLASSQQTGYYAIAFSVISVLIAIPALTVGSTLPVLARAARDDEKRLAYVVERLMEMTTIVGVGLGLALALGSGFVVRVLAGAKGHPAAIVLQIESLALITQFVGSSFQYGLLAIHRHRALLLNSAAGLLVSVVLTLALVPGLEARGAAVAFAIAEVVVAVGSYFYLRAARPDLTFSPRVPLCVLMAAAIGGGLAVVSGLSSLPASLIATVIYLGVLLALRAVPSELMHAVTERFQNKG
jgi:O-antigen/teichoic acid export membrane protein